MSKLAPRRLSYPVLKEAVPDYEELIKNFSCREKEINDFMVQRANDFEKKDKARNYFLLNMNQGKLSIVAYFAVSLYSIDIGSVDKTAKNKFLEGISHSGRSVPAYYIGQLARNSRYTTHDYSGTDILDDCFQVFRGAIDFVGINLVVVECRPVLYEHFYKKHNFISLTDTSSESYLKKLENEKTILAYLKLKPQSSYTK